MKERLKKVRLTLGYNLQEMSERLGMSSNTYIGYEYRTKNVPLDFLILLVKTFQININWLLTGEGLMFTSLKENTLERCNEINIEDKISLIGERLLNIQKLNNYQDKDMAKILGIYEDDYIELREGKREISYRIINKIKQSFKISIDWLLYGE